MIPLLFRRGVTPDDVYSYLKDSDDTRLRARGIYVRAEAIGPSGKRTVLKKDQVLDDSTCCIKIFTNRARAWQSHGDEQKSSGSASKNRNKGNTSKSKRKKGGPREKNNDGLDKHTRDRNKLIAKLHKSSDRQGKSKGGKGTGQSAAIR